MWELDHKECWSSKCQRMDAFKLWCWRRLLRVISTAQISNQLILKEINPEYSLKGLTLKLELKYFGHLMGKDDHWKWPWHWERLRARGEGVTEDEMVGWHHWLNRHEFEQIPGDSEGQGGKACCTSWRHKELDRIYLLNKNNSRFKNILITFSVIY